MLSLFCLTYSIRYCFSASRLLSWDCSSYHLTFKILHFATRNNKGGIDGDNTHKKLSFLNFALATRDIEDFFKYQTCFKTQYFTLNDKLNNNIIQIMEGNKYVVV